MLSGAGSDALTMLHPAVPSTAAGHRAATSQRQGRAASPPIWGAKAELPSKKGNVFAALEGTARPGGHLGTSRHALAALLPSRRA